MENKIRSIRAGDVFTGKLISVNQGLEFGEKKCKVVSISEDLEYLKQFGYNKYDIYVQESLGFGPVALWQSFIHQPISVTFECAG